MSDLRLVLAAASLLCCLALLVLILARRVFPTGRVPLGVLPLALYAGLFFGLALLLWQRSAARMAPPLTVVYSDPSAPHFRELLPVPATGGEPVATVTAPDATRSALPRRRRLTHPPIPVRVDSAQVPADSARDETARIFHAIESFFDRYGTPTRQAALSGTRAQPD